MGYNSVIFICNDAMDIIDKDPEGWWRETKKNLYKSQRENKPVNYEFKNYCNQFDVVSNRHADEVVLIAAGKNLPVIIDSQYYASSHHTTEGQIKFLERALKTLKSKLNK